MSAITSSQKLPLRLSYFLLYLAMLWVAAWLNEGWMQPDEHARTLEPALFILTRSAALPWEFTTAKPMVSFLLGVIHTPALFLGELLGLAPLSEAALLRAFSATVASTQLWAMAVLLRRLLTPHQRPVCWVWAFALNPMVPLLLTRTSQENWGTTAMLWGLVALVTRPGEGPAKPSRLFWGAFALSLATSFRLQLGPGLFCVMLWQFWTSKTLRSRGALTLGAITGLLPLAVVDYAMVGMPFKPAINYLLYALGDEEGGAIWGTNPWYDYIVHYLGSWYPPLSPWLLWPIIAGLIAIPQLSFAVIPFLAVHFILGHKEARYLSPMVPLTLLAMAVGWPRLKWNWVRKAFPYVAAAAGALCSVMWFFPQNFAPRFYADMARWSEREPMTYVGTTRTGPATFYTRFPPKLWPFLDTKAFVAQIEGKLAIKSGLYAIYRVDTDTLRKITQVCDLEYESSPQSWQWVLSWMPKNARWQRTDVMVRCGERKPQNPPPI